MASHSTMIQSNRLKQAFEANKGPSMGVWQMIPGSNVSRILARAGAEWVMVDCEHGNIDGRETQALPLVCLFASDKQPPDAAMHEAVPAIAALGVSPIVRIPDLQHWMIKRKDASVSSPLPVTDCFLQVHWIAEPTG